jgi:hypothetical protein
MAEAMPLQHPSLHSNPTENGLAEQVSYFFVEFSFDWPVVGLGEIVQLLEELSLLFAEVLGDDDVGGDKKIAAAVAVDLGNSFAANPEAGSRLRAGGDVQRLVAFECGNLNVRAERGLGYGDGDAAKQMLFVALENLVLADMDDHVEISRRASVKPGLSFADDAQAAIGIDAGGNADR